MTSRYKKSATFSINQVIESPDLSDLTLMIADGDVVDGFGNPKKIATILQQYNKSLHDTVEGIRNGVIPRSFYVPDLWHITFGKTPLFTREDADRIYEAWTLGHCLGDKYMSPKFVETEYPGTTFVPKS